MSEEISKYQSRESVIIGSQAMKYHFPDFPRIPMDTDVICTVKKFDETFISGVKSGDIERMQQGSSNQSFIIKWKDIPTPVEYLISDGLKSLELILSSLCVDSDYAPVQVLYSIRKAHINFPIKFDKHIKDLMFLREKLRQSKGISLEQDLMSEDDLLDEFPALTQIHFQETEKRLGKLRTPKMNQTTEEFFGKSKKYVKSYYVHDNMHKAIADMHISYPIYTVILKDNSEVETDELKWKNLNIHSKIYCVLEEVYVIALERKILPELFEISALHDNEVGRNPWTPKQAFDWALMRVCTTLCDGFFREFAIRAYDEIQKQYNPDYVELFFKNISKYEKIEEES